MHTFAVCYKEVVGGNLIYGVLINSVFNMGVTIFMLISGYFGVKPDLHKLVSILLTTILYSICSYGIQIYIGTETFGLKNFLKAFLPISSGRYWYITAYVLIMLFATYINRLIESLNKRELKILILMMFIIFSLLPTVIQIHVMNDGGKGVINLLLIYFIGRYIGLYGIDVKHKSILLILILGTETLLNIVATIMKGSRGVYAPFARDCSSFIIIGSVITFLLFKDIHFSSKSVNVLAKNVIGIYLFEGAVRGIIGKYIDISRYTEKWYLFLVVTAIAAVTIILCSFIELIRKIAFTSVEIKIGDIISQNIGNIELKVR